MVRKVAVLTSVRRTLRRLIIRRQRSLSRSFRNIKILDV